MSVLPRFDGAVMDNVPRPVPGANVAVYLQPTNPNPITPANFNPAIDTPLATIWQDSAGTIPLANPFQADGTGNYFFYAAANLYTVVMYGGTLAAPIVLIDQNLGSFTTGVTLQHNGSSNSTQTLLNLVAGSNITLTESAGAVTISSTAAPILLQTNGTNNSTQIKQNLVQGTGITIAESSGNITVSAPTVRATLQTNGTNNGSQSTLNLAAGSNITITDSGTGTDTFNVSWPAFQVNGFATTSQSPLNFVNGTNINATNPSVGQVQLNLTGIQDNLKFTSTTIASAALKTLRATPVQLLAAPGANKQFVVLRVVYEFVPVTTPYATVSTNDLAVYVDTTKATNYKGDSTGLIDQTAKTFSLVSEAAAKIITTDAHSTNQPLMVANVSAAEYTAGDGSLVVNVSYIILSTT